MPYPPPTKTTAGRKQKIKTMKNPKIKFLPEVIEIEGVKHELNSTFNINNAIKCYDAMKLINGVANCDDDFLLQLDILRSNNPNQENILFMVKLMIEEVKRLAKNMEYGENLCYNNLSN